MDNWIDEIDDYKQPINQQTSRKQKTIFGTRPETDDEYENPGISVTRCRITR